MVSPPHPPPPPPDDDNDDGMGMGMAVAIDCANAPSGSRGLVAVGMERTRVPFGSAPAQRKAAAIAASNSPHCQKSTTITGSQEKMELDE